MVITLFWLPHCLVYYPIRMGGGCNFQIAQFFGEVTLARNMSSVVYEGHYLSNHHPVLTTIFYGSFFKLGNFLGNTNIVVFLLSLITLLISSFCMAYTLTIIKKYIANRVYIFLLVFVCIYPIYGIYSYTCCKDNLFASLLLVFISQLLEIMFTGGEILKHRSFIVGHIFVTILIPFLKNQGSILIVITSLLFMIVKNKEIRKVMLMDICCVIIIYTVLFTHILMPMLKIAPGGRQEALSLPFQQTAYYVTLYGEELNEKEYEAINAVLPVDELWSLYEPNRADAVKFKFNQNASTKDLINYFKVWISQFFKHPQAYISAFFRMTDRYYFWGAEEFDLYSLTDNFYEVYAPKWEWYRNFNRSYDTMLNSFMNLPLIRIIVKIPFMTWTMMLTLFYCVYRRWRRCFLIMLPVFLSFGICLLSPWNGVIRYALPITYSFPIMICILMKQEKTFHVKEDKEFF